MHMHDIEVVVIWFFLVNAGMLLTLLMPRIVSEPRSCEVTHDEYEGIHACEELQERAA
jgi:hypothetical protein